MDEQAGGPDDGPTTNAADVGSRCYRSLASRLGDGLFRLDAGERFVDVDEAFADLTGRPREDLLGTPASAVLSADDGRLAEAIRATHEGSEDGRMRLTVDADGRRRPVECRFDVVETEAGREVAGVVERIECTRLEAELDEVFGRVSDAFFALDEDWTFTYLNERAHELINPDGRRLVGKDVWEEFPDAIGRMFKEKYERAMHEQVTVAFEEYYPEPLDRWFEVRAYPSETGLSVYFRDVTERTEYKQRLQALNRLNEVVHDISDAVIEQSTREEIERIACERLAESDSYEFAWIGETHPATREIEPRAMAGTDGYLDDVTISIDPDDPESEGPTGRALRTGETRTIQHVREDSRYEAWRGIAEEYGFEASAAIPIRHEDTIFGVLNVYTARPDGFESEERTVVDHLGEIIGHAIASVQRKQALMSDTVVELEVGIPNVVEDLGVDIDRLELDRAVPLGDDDFFVYGTSATDLTAVEALVEKFPSWEALTVVDDESDPVRFQVRLSEPPMLSALASVGGSVEHAVVEDGEYRMTVHLPESADVRTVIDTLQDIYPQADAIARRQVSVSEESAQQVTEAWMEELTDRQLTALEVAYFSGFFEWPRGSSGEEVAESLGVSSPTFHQHVRSAERKLLDVVLSETGSGRTSVE